MNRFPVRPALLEFATAIVPLWKMLATTPIIAKSFRFVFDKKPYSEEDC